MLPWSKRPRPEWCAEPALDGLRLVWRVAGKAVAPDLPAPSAREIPEAHRILGDMLHAAAVNELQVERQPAVRISGDAYVLSTAAIYAGLARAETNDEGVIACRDLLELLPYLATSIPGERAAEVRLRSRGDFNARDFTIEHEVDVLPRRPVPHQRVGPFICDSGGQVYLLPRPVYELVQRLAEPWPHAPLARLRHWGEIRPMAIASGAQLDSYLRNENVVLVEKIRPEIAGLDGDGLHIRPGIDHPRSAEFAGNISAFSEARELYNVAGVGIHGRVRFVPSEDALDAIRAVKRRSVLQGDEIPRFLSCPEALFPEDGFDLSEFGERVVGVGAYVYRAVPYMGGRDRARDWFDWDGEGCLPDLGVELANEGAAEDGQRLSLSTPTEASEAQRLLTEAWESGREYVEIRPGCYVSCDEVAGWIERASQLHAAPTPRARRNLVLRILENIEGLDFHPGSFADVDDAAILDPPVGLSAAFSLMPHQVRGYSWLFHRTAASPPLPAGGLLADDMGLGKTLQLLCVLAKRRAAGAGRPVLVVAPVSVLENWQREATAFFPGMFDRMLTLAGSQGNTAGQMEQYDLVLTSYETLRGPVQFEAARVLWDLVILDEAQRVKNPTTRASIAVKSLRARARVALTATPVENSLSELWNIIDFLAPGYLGSLRDFHRTHVFGWQNAVPEEQERLASQLIERLQPVLLRRTKQEVLELPPKRLSDPILVPLSSEQSRLYDQALSQLHSGRAHPLAVLPQLFKICAHPGLVDASLLSYIPPKLERTLEILEHIRAQGEKALIFASSHRIQAVFQEIIRHRFAVNAPVINGSSEPRTRQSLIDQFSRADGFGVLILGPRAAGIGLNITAANHVIHYTREWNPAVEAQATDRAYRIGQTRPVTVYYPIVHRADRPTVEDTLDDLLAEKEGLARSVVRPTSELMVTAAELVRRL